MSEETDMEKRITSLEHGLELTKLEQTHANQRVASSLEGVQSQLAEISRSMRESLARQETANEDEIGTLNNTVSDVSKEVKAIDRKLTWFAGAAAAFVAVGGISWGIITWFINDKVNTLKEEKQDTIKRIEKAEAKNEEVSRTLHRIELYLSRRGEPDRGAYTGDDKK